VKHRQAFCRSRCSEAIPSVNSQRARPGNAASKAAPLQRGTRA
jgi:hypothetical protein